MALYNANTVYGSGGLQELSGVDADDVALAQAYDEAGDGGGGEFRFVAPEGAWTIDSLTVRSANITAVANSAGQIEISATAHGFITGHRVRVEGVDASVDGDWTVANETTNTFELAGSTYTASFGAGGSASGAVLVTTSDHGLATVTRLAIGGTTSFDNVYDGVFNFATNTLVFPTDAGVGTGTVTAGYIGDGGLHVPSVAEAGRWERRIQTPIDVKWYGAKADATEPFPDPMLPYTATDNSLAFKAALAAMPNDNPAVGGGYPLRVVANGWFYLGDTLHLVRSVLLEGMGQADPTHKPGTMLLFPTDTTGIRIHSAIDLDVPEGMTLSGVGASDSQLRRVTIVCKDRRGEEIYEDTQSVPPNGHTGHGIHSSTVFALRDIAVQNFAEDGIHVASQGIGTDVYPGNAAGSHLSNTSSSLNGGHGFFFLGADANVCLIEMCFADVNWMNGFHDEGGIGNTYVACYTQGNLGGYDGYGADFRNHDFYVVNDNVNQSTFFGCYSEASVDHIFAPAGAIGGILSEGTFVGGNGTGFALTTGGVSTMGPIVSEYKYDYNGPRVEIGDSTEARRAMTFIARKDGYPVDFMSLLHQANIRDRFRDWWEIQSNNSPYEPMLRFPTGPSGARHPAPWAANGLFVGRDYEEGSPIHFEVSGSVPDTQYNGTAQSYEKGDVVWTNAPSIGQALGWVCLSPGTGVSATLTGVTASAPSGSQDIVVSDSSALLVGQYIAIDGIAGTFLIDGLGLPASVENLTDGPYALDEGQTLIVKVDAGSPQTVTFTAAALGVVDMSALTAGQIATYLEDLDIGLSAEATSGGDRITLTSVTHDYSRSHIWITGGTANGALNFAVSPVRGTADSTSIHLTEAIGTMAAAAEVSFVNAEFAPFGMTGPRGETAGQLSVEMGDSDQSVTAEDLYGAAVVKVTSSTPFTVDRLLTFPRPATDADSYQRTIRASLSGANLLVDVEDGLAPITIEESKTATIGFDADGAYRISPDV